MHGLRAKLHVNKSILQGFGCLVLAHDLAPNAACEAAGVQYVSLEDLLQRSDVVSLHCPLLPSTKHMLGVDRYHHGDYSFHLAVSMPNVAMPGA